ncbi:MAG: thioredoxin family protein, partial [Candidatus Krumholzibacteria bacterium]|nr:thioredoxin family protein [Candidatus Krumholzibacteria bacterium]
MRGMHVILAAMLCASVVAGCGERGGSKDSANASSGGGAVMWLSFNDGMALAAKDKKHVVIDFYTTWCRWCKVMDEKTFSDPDVKKYLAEHFVTIRIDAENNNERVVYQGRQYTSPELAKKFGVRGFPSLAYLDREGELVTVIPGFVPAEKFLPLLHYMEKECYKRQI